MQSSDLPVLIVLGLHGVVLPLPGDEPIDGGLEEVVVHLGQQLSQVAAHGRVVSEALNNLFLALLPIFGTRRLVENPDLAVKNLFMNSGFIRSVEIEFDTLMKKVLVEMSVAIHVNGPWKHPVKKTKNYDDLCKFIEFTCVKLTL